MRILGKGKIGELQERIMYRMGVDLLEPYPPWWPTWCLMTRRGGIIPVSKARLTIVLKELLSGEQPKSTYYYKNRWLCP